MTFSKGFGNMFARQTLNEAEQIVIKKATTADKKKGESYVVHDGKKIVKFQGKYMDSLKRETAKQVAATNSDWKVASSAFAFDKGLYECEKFLNEGLKHIIPKEFQGADKAAYTLGFNSARAYKPKLSNEKIVRSFGSKSAVNAYLKGYGFGQDSNETEDWHDQQKMRASRGVFR